MAITRDDRTALALAGVLTSSGVLHFVRPAPFVSIVPRSLPHPKALVAASGVAELACAALLVRRPTRRIAGLLTAATFVAVFPANVSMALRSGRRPPWYRVIAWLRLPGQLPLVAWALRVAEAAR